MVENTTVKRRTNAKKAKEAAAVITPRLLTEEDAAIYLGVSVGTLRNKRGDTPLRWTEETWKRVLEGEEIPPIPFKKIGTSVRYDIQMLDRWIDVQMTVGRLPGEGNTS